MHGEAKENCQLIFVFEIERLLFPEGKSRGYKLLIMVHYIPKGYFVVSMKEIGKSKYRLCW